jgi:signal peptidase I
VTDPKPRPKAGLRRVRGPWRVAVNESSMRPAIAEGDWLLVDPTTRRWPPRGAVVVIREPDSETLAIKRVAAGPGDRVEHDEGHIVLGLDEAWLLSDAADAELLAAGLGQPIDSRRYGPVPLDCLLGRAWFRYGPLRRIGRIAERRPLP